MKLKKIIAAIAATAVAVSTMAVTAFAGQDPAGFADGTAFLNINDSNWGTPDGEWTNVEITGDGTYTVALTGATAFTMGQFNALDIVNGETVFGREYTVTIDSIKINGVESKIEEGYTCSADGGAITTRVNIFNEWNNPSEEVSADGYVDNRCADGDFMSKSARMVTAAIEGITDIEVTFTVAGIGAGAATDAADTATETTTEAPATGNAPIAGIAVVMALAGTAAVVSKKK